MEGGRRDEEREREAGRAGRGKEESGKSKSMCDVILN